MEPLSTKESDLAFATLFDDARATLEELKDEPYDPKNPAHACAIGALHVLRYFSDSGDALEDVRDAARILRLIALSFKKLKDQAV